MLMNAATPQACDELYQQYLVLTPYEQAILKILAVTYWPIGTTKLNKLMSLVKQHKCFDGAGALRTLKQDQKDKLVAEGFIELDRTGSRIMPLLANRLAHACVDDGSYIRLVNCIELVLPARAQYEWQKNVASELCLIRDLYFLDQGEGLERVVSFHKNPQIIDVKTGQILFELYCMPFVLQPFLALADALQYQIFATGFMLSSQQGGNTEYLLSLLEVVCEHNPKNLPLQQLLAEQYLAALRLDDFKRIYNAGDKTSYGLQLSAAYNVILGQFEQADELFQAAMVAKNKYGRRKRQYIGGYLGLLYKLCLLVLASQKGAEHFDRVLEQYDYEDMDKNTDGQFKLVLRSLYFVAKELSSSDADYHGYYSPHDSPAEVPLYFHLQYLLFTLGKVWGGDKLTKKTQQELAMTAEFFAEAGWVMYQTLAEQTCEWGSLPKKDRDDFVPVADGMVYFPTLVSRKAEWDLALEKLMALSPSAVAAKSSEQAKPEKPVRMIWELCGDLRAPTFKAREQKHAAKGWSKGRTVALKRLCREADSFTYLTDADQKMCEAIAVYQSWDYYQSTEYRLEGVDALLAAKDLDNLYLEGDLEHAIDLIQKEPELLVSQQGKQLLLSIADIPTVNYGGMAFHLHEQSPGSYAFTLFNESHLQVAEIIGEGGLVIPLAAKAKVLASVSAIAPLLNIQSDIDELETGLETRTCDEHLVINIQPLEAGLEFTCMVMPFGEQGPAFKPIVGNAKITAEVDGKRLATQRDLIKEQLALDALDENCPAFLGMPDNVLAVEDAQDALEALEQLEQVLNTEPLPFQVRLRWPKGKKLNLSKTLESQHLTLSAGKRNEWFDLTGSLEVDEEQVIELRKLLDLVNASNGRFIELDSGQVLALSQDLRERLDVLNQVTDAGKFHPLAAQPVAEATTGMRMKTLHAWEAQTQKMHESNDIVPEVPATLQAELRDYQYAGFDWMCRLAHWQAGACLADDMGLGKTLQALTLLLDRAPDGPSLVIAPTSVCFNWQQEALKFAPTLNVINFADFSTVKQREELLAKVAGFDCVIISYGLLQRASELLSTVQWRTIVADEAQALKNPLAKRTQAAYALKGDFKVITTGTPIENNLTELWSLFRFITPGLLGNIKQFNARYATPIENVKEDGLKARKASLGLKMLIQPFILRRMKNQVLQELPSRTEINVHVELSKKEQDFYEALRRNAIDNISAASKASNQGAQRIKMLAELVKLRQACCNPQLVMPETNLPSAKLEALDELLDELQQNNHKALIFSQFVGHLQLLKKHLEKRGISYQYLDGSTTQKARKKGVEAFQKGEGDVFLISLKAGGSGLNLTAADYVIHMDPWWNPAVEEQASDRAHRMGQKRPVTIYRLIAKNTIEERIVELHQHKRDLADKLLAGNETATKLSVDDVLNMLKETF